MAIAGATGFVGEAIRTELLKKFSVIGLTRSPTRAELPDPSGIQWRYCDLFSLQELTLALQGVDYAVYLVHSMHPSARLVQASFADLDLLLADNFARAAEKNRVKQIVYVGGIRPSPLGGDCGPKAASNQALSPSSSRNTRDLVLPTAEDTISPHLRSRLEVEATLASRSTPITALRAGIIVGPGGSSLNILVQLVRRLPVMILPKWTESLSAPISIQDLVRATLRCLGRDDTYNQSFDIGGPETLSYRTMMVKAAEVLSRSIPMLRIPVFSPSLSTLWVSTVSGAPRALVGPLIESLGHSILPKKNWLQTWLVKDAIRFEDALRGTIDEQGKLRANPRKRIRRSDDTHLRKARTVRSVQRLPLPTGKTVTWASETYAQWLPKVTWPFIQVTCSPEGVLHFQLRAPKWTLLELTPSETSSTPDRRLYLITGGILAQVSPQFRGRFEFRQILGQQAMVAAIHDFRPKLPWPIYNITQALVHLWVMRRFGQYLKHIDKQSSPPKLSVPPEHTTPR